MNSPADFFAEFPPVSKDQWLARIAQDLKGKPIEELYWQLNRETSVDPFGHADDLAGLPEPLSLASVAWEINEDVDAGDWTAMNRQAIEALAFGADSLYFPLVEKNVSAALETLLHRIHLDFISLHFGGNGTTAGPAAVLSALGDLARQQGLGPEQLRGSLYYDPAAEPGRIHDWRYLEELLRYAGETLPGFRCLTVDGRADFNSAAAVPHELAAVVRKGLAYLEKLEARGLEAVRVAGQMQFAFYIGNSYFVEIAKLRAFKILWINALKAWDVEPAYPVLDVRFAPGAYTDTLYSNMIRATTMAMSAVLGGANRLTVLPYDAGREAQAAYPRAFARRIARNVQHLLKLETGLTDAPDPASGSYYLEQLTGQLATAAWSMVKP